MDKKVFNKGAFHGGYFILNKKIQTMEFLGGENFVVTHDNKREILDTILEILSSAKQYVKICSFIIDNKDVVDLLKKQMKDRGLSVFILTAVNEEKIKVDILDDDESNDFTKSRHFEFIDELAKAGAHIRASSNAHAKFIVEDGEKALIMSANLTDPSLRNNDKGKNPNDESGIVISEIHEVDKVERIFDSIFLYGTEFKKFISISERTQLISKQEIDICKDDFPSNHTNIIWSYDKIHHLIYENINLAIESANESINLSTYSIIELGNLAEFVSALSNFIQNKKGTVKIFCRAMNHRNDHLESCCLLAEMGVELYGDIFNHSKGISIDNDNGIIFTANIDGRHGLKSGFEIGYKIQNDNKVFVSFNSFLRHQIQTAPFIFSLSPLKEDVFEFYRFLYKEKGKSIFEGLPEILNVGFKKNTSFSNEFKNDISNYPIFYSLNKSQAKTEILFEINERVYLLEMLNDNSLELKERLFKRNISGEKYLFFYKELNLWSYES